MCLSAAVAASESTGHQVAVFGRTSDTARLDTAGSPVAVLTLLVASCDKEHGSTIHGGTCNDTNTDADG